MVDSESEWGWEKFRLVTGSMQLFISPNYTKQKELFCITDERIIYQCTKVLRYKPGDVITLQDNWMRYELKFLSRDKKKIDATCIHQISCAQLSKKITMVVAMSNKWDKMELIAQKMAELSVHTLIIRVSKRSVITSVSGQKIERLKTIMLEASEQSWNRSIPQLEVITNIEKIPTWVVAYQNTVVDNKNANHALGKSVLVIGPEWGFDDKELQYFMNNNFEFHVLWDSILRMETAAIVWARWMTSV